MSSSPVTVLEDLLNGSPSDSPDHTTSCSIGSSDAEPVAGLCHYKQRLAALPRGIASVVMRCRFKHQASDCSVPHLKHFKLKELRTATRDFSTDCLIGRGSHAEVYQGRFRDGTVAAIKRYKGRSVKEMEEELLHEVGMMAHLNHPNTAKAMGYGVEGGMHLVLEFAPLGSLCSLLHNSSRKMEWNARYKVAVGTARGLLYLHEVCGRRIIHRDVKAANVLLSEDFEPQICDFGLARWLPRQWTHVVVPNAEGTFGYLAPELLSQGVVDEKTDVFAFGVLLLELVTGRRALDYSKRSLVMWTRPMLRKNKMKELIDARLGHEYNMVELNLVSLAASLCIQESVSLRPRMNQILLILKGGCGSLELMRNGVDISSCQKFYQQLFSSNGGH